MTPERSAVRSLGQADGSALSPRWAYRTRKTRKTDALASARPPATVAVNFFPCAFAGMSHVHFTLPTPSCAFPATAVLPKRPAHVARVRRTSSPEVTLIEVADQMRRC